MSKKDIIAILEGLGIPHNPNDHWKTLEKLLPPPVPFSESPAPAQSPVPDTGTAPESEPAPAETPATSPVVLILRKGALMASYFQTGKPPQVFHAVKNDDGTLNLYRDPECSEIVVGSCQVGAAPGQAAITSPE